MVGSDKIKKQMLVGFPGEIDLQFSPASNRYYEPGQEPPLSIMTVEDVTAEPFETEQINNIPF
jgi:hypothetical protein